MPWRMEDYSISSSSADRTGHDAINLQKAVGEYLGLELQLRWQWRLIAIERILSVTLSRDLQSKGMSL